MGIDVREPIGYSAPVAELNLIEGEVAERETVPTEQEQPSMEME